MHTIRRISPGSAFKVGAMLTGLLFLIMGFFTVLLPGLFGASLLGALMGDSRGDSAFGAGIVGALLGYGLGIVITGIFGGVVTAIEAWLYNIVAGWTGGLEVELS